MVLSNHRCASSLSFKSGIATPPHCECAALSTARPLIFHLTRTHHKPNLHELRDRSVAPSRAMSSCQRRETRKGHKRAREKQPAVRAPWHPRGASCFPIHPSSQPGPSTASRPQPLRLSRSAQNHLPPLNRAPSALPASAISLCPASPQSASPASKIRGSAGRDWPASRRTRDMVSWPHQQLPRV